MVIFFFLNTLDNDFSVADSFIKNKLILLLLLLDKTFVDNSIILDIPPISLSNEKTENIFFSKIIKNLFFYTIKT